MKSKKLTLMAVILIVLVISATTYYMYSPKNEMVTTILKEAEQYKVANSSYGVIPNFDQNNYNCFSGNTFLRNTKVQEILADMSVTNVACQFKVDPSTSMLEVWSVSLQIGERVYCGDSSGSNQETPGLTVTTSCKGE